MLLFILTWRLNLIAHLIYRGMMRDLRHTRERNTIRAEMLRKSYKLGIFVDEFDQVNPAVSLGPYGSDGKPVTFEPPLKFICKQCGRKYGSNVCPNCGIGPA